MAVLPASIEPIKAEIAAIHSAARQRHRHGDDAFGVVEAISDGVDSLLRRLFLEALGEDGGGVALVAVGGYGRRELCPFSDIDLLFLRPDERDDERLKRLIRLLWDGGFQLGHAVRTVSESFKFMCQDHVTAATLLESRFLTGNERLFRRFESQAVGRYRRFHGRPFARGKVQALRESLDDPARTIYVVEPHIKEGPCCLRDIQRVLWVENVRHALHGFQSLRDGVFHSRRVDDLREAYGFYLRVRCELHFTNGVRQDIVERDVLPEIVRNLGYGGSPRQAVEEFMGSYYRHARHVYRFLRHYLETETQGRPFLQRLRQRLFAKQIKPYLVLHRGNLFLRSEPQVERLNEEIMDIFVIAHRENVRLSESLREWIRAELETRSLDFTHSTVVHHALLLILRGGHNTGRVLKALHETGILGRVLPEFAKLEGLVNLDGHHHFTVDEHTLRTQGELDRLERGEGDEAFGRLLEEIKDRLPLRLALLLHDVGKTMPGDHAVSGSEAALLVCERLGLKQEVCETVEFLVYRHLEMFKVSASRDFTEDRVIERLALLVSSEERLKMLYLLTYLDIVSVGPGTWTAWKGAQLAELFQRTMIRLRTGTLPARVLEEVLAASGLDEEERASVLEHCRQIGSLAYERETLPERMLQHARLVETFRTTGEIQAGHTSLPGIDEITFCCRDRAHLFADLAGILFSEGLNVLGARIFSRGDGVVIDVFQVEIADAVQVGVARRAERIRDKLRRIESKRTTVDDLIRQRARTYRSVMGPRPLYGPSVSFDNGASDVFTLVEVSAPDRPGLLYDLSNALSRLGLDVQTAKISTLGDRAHDVFYVAEADGHKVLNPARMKQIELSLNAEASRRLCALLESGVFSSP